jgi:hypothetical protein
MSTQFKNIPEPASATPLAVRQQSGESHRCQNCASILSVQYFLAQDHKVCPACAIKNSGQFREVQRSGNRVMSAVTVVFAVALIFFAVRNSPHHWTSICLALGLVQLIIGVRLSRAIGTSGSSSPLHLA